MSSFLYSVLAQSGTGSDWNWLLTFLVVVVILAVALIVQARYSEGEAADLGHHGDETHSDEAELTPAATLEPEASSEPEENETVPEVVADNLERIEGIGPKVATLLNESGIATFAQLAEMSVDDLAGILEASKLQMMNPVSWPQQAKLAAEEDWEALEKLQNDLKGGR